MNGFTKTIAVCAVVLGVLAVGGAETLKAQAGLDLKALVNTRTDELIKLAQGLKVDTGSLSAFKQSFNADQMEAAIKSLNALPVVISIMSGLGLLKKLDEAVLQAGLYKLTDALELFLETVKKQETKICVGLYMTEKKEERIIAPFVNEAPKEISGTVPLKLQSQQCI
ncbi:MAG: hypothetical protein NZ930_00575 [Candidatus Bipolaricaulota bacterium]|nr:hypothetical protein [Candidatus Bipolaricaulota bacterium]MDW8031198.1 hypothetical protein [Candidatus Bipolaricaulota bacterium]